MISPSKLNCYNLLFCCSSICLMISPPPQGVNEVRLEPFEKVGEFQQTMGFCECVPILKGLPRNQKKKKKKKTSLLLYLLISGCSAWDFFNAPNVTFCAHLP